MKSCLPENLNQCVCQLHKQTDSLFIAGPVNTASLNTYIYEYCYTDMYNVSNHCKLIFMTKIDIEIFILYGWSRDAFGENT